MFSQISWIDYISTIAIVTIFYYAVISVKYYRHDILYYVSVKSATGSDSGFIKGIEPKPGLIAFTDELTAFLAESSNTGNEKQSVLSGIQRLLKRHPFVDTDKQTINQLIASQCEQYCSVILSDVEMEELWGK